jgi:very-short-patch-repair endonuclease
MASPEEYRRGIRQAEVRGLPTGLAVRPAPTRSELEDRFLALCRHHRLPEPEVNVRIGAVTVDFLWRERRLVVETDGYRYHRGETAFEQDHARDLRLRALGYDVMRLSFWQVTRDPEAVAALISRELAGGGRPREPDRREA